MEGGPSKKQRILARLVTARAKDTWISRKELLKIASRGYVDRLLPLLYRAGLVERRGVRGRYVYRASKQLASKLLILGRVPRSKELAGTKEELAEAGFPRLKPEERPRGHTVKLRPVTEFLDPDATWIEHQKVRINLDQYTAGLLRNWCNPPSRRDRAQQRSYTSKKFSLTIAKRGSLLIIVKEKDWMRSFVEWLHQTGLSKAAISSILGKIEAHMPDRYVRAEMPVLDREVKAMDVQFVVSTRVGDEKIVSNINYSSSIDFEIYGKGYLVQQWLSVLAGTQHNQVVALVALEHQVADLVKTVEELRKEREAAEEKEVEKKRDDMYV